MSTGEQGEVFEQPSDPLAELETMAARLERLEAVAQDLMQPAEVEAEDAHTPPAELDDRQLARYLGVAERIGDVAARLTLTAQTLIEERSGAALEARRLDALVKLVSGQYFRPREVKAHLVERGLWDPNDRFTYAQWERRIQEHAAAQGTRTTWLRQTGGARILAWLAPPPVQESAEEKTTPTPKESQKSTAEDVASVAQAEPESEPEPGPAPEEALPAPPPATPPASPLTPLFRPPEQEPQQPVPPPTPKNESSPDLDPAFDEKELIMARGILEYLHQATPAHVSKGVRKRAVANEVRQTLHVPHTAPDDYLEMIDRLILRGFIQQDLIPPDSGSQRHGKVLRPRRQTEMTIENMLATLSHPHAISQKDPKRGS